MRYIAMNRFEVVAGKGPEFEAVWRNRQSLLQGVSGFVEFHLLRGAENVYVSHSVWETEAAFVAWTESEAFQQAHAQGGSRGMLQGPPQLSGYQIVL